MTLPRFPDVEVVTMDWLEREFPVLAGRTGVVTPPDLQSRLPFVRVGRVTGRDDFVTDYSVVDIDVFAGSRQASYDLAEDIRSRLLGYPHVVGTDMIDRIVTETAPFRAPWEDETVSRHLATYRISTRR